MKKTMKRGLSLVLAGAMTLSLVSVGAFADDAKVGDFRYKVDESGKATITAIESELKGVGSKGLGTALLIPAEVAGHPVDSVAVQLLTNYEGDVLFAEGITTIPDGAIYDVGNAGQGYFSFPSTIANITKGAFQSSQDTFYSASEAATAAATEFGLKAGEAATSELTIEAGDNGAVYPNGTFLVPETSSSYTTIAVAADAGYVIDTLTVAGAPVEAAAGQASYTQNLTVNAANDVVVTFKASGEAPAETTEPAGEYVAPAIVEGAVAEGTELPADVNEQVVASDSWSNSSYEQTMGIETGTYYAVDGQIYQMVGITQNGNDGTLLNSKAEAINYFFTNDNLVYGEDYDLIRLYNWVATYSQGPRPGEFFMSCAYAYKLVGDTVETADTNADYEAAYEHIVDGEHQQIQGDVATLMVQEGSTVTVNGLNSNNYTIAYGPSEAANFYGLGSSVLVDGGVTENYKITSGDAYSFNQDTDASSVILNNPTIIGSENVLYAVAGGTAYVYGGRCFGCSSGGHGFYVGRGGKIAVNADTVLDENGVAVTDVTKLTAAERPAIDLGTAVGNTSATQEEISSWTKTAAVPVYDENASEDVTIIVTADETGTALTTDTGGGVIVANNVSATTYGRGCAGVYSIGSDESYVYVYNSALHSNMDAALCSASAGYIFAYNSVLQGVDGLKTRSGGSGSYAGIHVYNSEIICEFDPENYEGMYDMCNAGDEWPEAYANWSWADDTSMVNCPMLNLFVNKTNCTYGSDLSDTMEYWFADKDIAPQTGEAIAPICSTGTAPIEVTASYIVNNNYNNYKDQGASNILIAADNGGSGTITFTDCNSQTKWDLTGADEHTTELYGNISIAAIITMSGPDAGSGPSTANVVFNNSEWKGSVTGYGTNANFTFDKASVWTVDNEWAADNGNNVTVGTLVLDNENNIVSETPVNVIVMGTVTIAGTELTETTTYGNVTYVIGSNSAHFTDMAGYNWAAEAADNLFDNGITAGVEAYTYGPDQNITREMMIQMIYKLADGEATDDMENPFSDVTENNYFYDAVRWAYANGITAGMGDGKFGTGLDVTRQDAILQLYKAKEAIGYDLVDAEKATAASFSDIDNASAYALEAITALSNYELKDGEKSGALIAGNADGTLAPKSTMTRAEMACMLNAALNAIPQSSGMGGMGGGGMGGDAGMGGGDMGGGDMGGGDMGGADMGVGA